MTSSIFKVERLLHGKTVLSETGPAATWLCCLKGEPTHKTGPGMLGLHLLCVLLKIPAEPSAPASSKAALKRKLLQIPHFWVVCEGRRKEKQDFVEDSVGPSADLLKTLLTKKPFRQPLPDLVRRCHLCFYFYVMGQ